MWIYFSFLLGISLGVKTNDKRLLLGDPDVIGARFINIETRQHQLTELVTRLNKSLATMKITNDKIKTDLEREKIKTATLESMMSTLQFHGSTYIQWGRRHCTEKDAEEVYSGYTAGQYFNPTSGSQRYGGPADILCLPNNPELTNKTIPDYSMIYGAEFEGSGFQSGAINEDIPFTVCRNPRASESIMIPGRKSCYAGWNIEYNGLIASGYSNDKASSYICMDMHPEYIPGGQRDEDGHRIWLIKSKCGSLPCPPYHNDYAFFIIKTVFHNLVWYTLLH